MSASAPVASPTIAAVPPAVTAPSGPSLQIPLQGGAGDSSTGADDQPADQAPPATPDAVPPKAPTNPDDPAAGTLPPAAIGFGMKDAAFAAEDLSGVSGSLAYDLRLAALADSGPAPVLAFQDDGDREARPLAAAMTAVALGGAWVLSQPRGRRRRIGLAAG
jgi:hypothetical protein